MLWQKKYHLCYTGVWCVSLSSCISHPSYSQSPIHFSAIIMSDTAYNTLKTWLTQNCLTLGLKADLSSIVTVHKTVRDTWDEMNAVITTMRRLEVAIPDELKPLPDVFNAAESCLENLWPWLRSIHNEDILDSESFVQSFIEYSNWIVQIQRVPLRWNNLTCTADNKDSLNMRPSQAATSKRLY